MLQFISVDSSFYASKIKLNVTRKASFVAIGPKNGRTSSNKLHNDFPVPYPCIPKF